jgi:hypothetical protein
MSTSACRIHHARARLVTRHAAGADPPPPWMHLPDAEQEAIELALAEAFVAWIDREAAQPTTPPHQEERQRAVSAGVSNQPQEEGKSCVPKW